MEDIDRTSGPHRPTEARRPIKTGRQRWAETTSSLGAGLLGAGVRPAWSAVLYWVCWLLPAGLAVRLAIR